MEFKPTRLYAEDDFSKTEIKEGSIVLATATKFLEPTLYCEVNGMTAKIDSSDVNYFIRFRKTRISNFTQTGIQRNYRRNGSMRFCNTGNNTRICRFVQVGRFCRIRSC